MLEDQNHSENPSIIVEPSPHFAVTGMASAKFPLQLRRINQAFFFSCTSGNFNFNYLFASKGTAAIFGIILDAWLLAPNFSFTQVLIFLLPGIFFTPVLLQVLKPLRISWHLLPVVIWLVIFLGFLAVGITSWIIAEYNQPELLGEWVGPGSLISFVTVYLAAFVLQLRTVRNLNVVFKNIAYIILLLLLLLSIILGFSKFFLSCLITIGTFALMVMLILGLDLAGRMFTSLALIRDFELISDFAGSDKSDFNQLRQLIQEICHIRAGQFGFDRVSAVLKRGEFIRAKLSIDTFYQLYTGTDRVKVRQAKILNGLLNIILSSNPEQCRQGIWELLITFDEILLSGYMQLYWKFPSDFEKYQQLLEMRKSYWQKNLALEKGWFYPTSGKSPITVADEELLLNYHKGREAKLFSGLWRIVGYSVGIRTKWVLNITLAFTAFGGFGLFILLIKLNLLGAVDLTVPSYAHSSSSFYLLLYSPLLLSTIGASWIFGWQLFMNPVTRFGISNEISFIVKLGLALFIICIVLVLPFVAWSDNSYATARLSSVAFLDTSSRGMTQLNREGGLEKIDFETLRVQAISEHFGPEAWMLATSSNDRFAAVWLNSQIKIWDWNSQKEFASLPYNEKDEVILSAAFSPDSSFLMIIGFSKNTSNSISPLDFVIRTWSLKDFTLTVILRESTETVNKYAAGFNPNGTILAFGGFHRDLILWNSTSYKEIGHLKQPIQELVQQSVEVVDSDFDISKAVTSLAFSQDSKIVAAGTYDGYIYIWDVATTKLLRVLVGHYGRINSLRFDPQTQSLISTSSDLTMKFWRLDNTND